MLLYEDLLTYNIYVRIYTDINLLYICIRIIYNLLEVFVKMCLKISDKSLQMRIKFSTILGEKIVYLVNCFS